MEFTLDSQKFKQDMGRIGQRMAQGAPKAAHALAVQMAKDTEPYVPARTKSLANRTQVNGDTIIYPGPYAHYLYVGKLFTSPDTGSSWAAPGANKVMTGKDLKISKAVHGKAQSHWFEASKAQNLDKWRRAAAKVVGNEFGRYAG